MISPALGAACLFAIILGVLLIGLPIAFTLGLAGLVSIVLGSGWTDWLDLAGGTAVHNLSSFGFLAFPLFILMGTLVTESGLGPRLIDFALKWMSRVPGPLHAATVLACGIFSSFSGSSVATAAAVGGIVLPEMKRRGHDLGLGMGAVAAGGTLGVMIPPSAHFILYGELTQTSVAALFLAGIVPAAILIVVFLAYTMLAVVRRPALAPPIPEGVTWVDRWIALRRIWTGLILMAAVLGGIFFGIVTPTEAAGLGALVALLLGLFVIRGLRLPTAYQAALKAVQAATMIGFIILGGLILGRGVVLLGISDEMVTWIGHSGLARWQVLLLVNVLLLLLGTIMDGAGIVLVMTPLLFPVMTDLGFDPIWFGVMFGLNMELGLIHPPVGLNLFVIQSVTGEPIGRIFRGTLPYAALMLAVLVLIIVFPDIVLWLPNLVEGGS
jgi:C4-dicarboxylate transporter DctM subunit